MVGIVGGVGGMVSGPVALGMPDGMHGGVRVVLINVDLDPGDPHRVGPSGSYGLVQVVPQVAIPVEGPGALGLRASPTRAR